MNVCPQMDKASILKDAIEYILQLQQLQDQEHGGAAAWWSSERQGGGDG